jgi:hypothetical protein
VEAHRRNWVTKGLKGHTVVTSSKLQLLEADDGILTIQ